MWLVTHLHTFLDTLQNLRAGIKLAFAGNNLGSAYIINHALNPLTKKNKHLSLEMQLPVRILSAIFNTFVTSMSLYITSLNSGSNGNCYYIANEQEAVLIDAGIACREIETRMKRLKLDPQQLKAIFISHEHSDHIKGVEVFSKKFNLPVYITPKTYHKSGLKIDSARIRSFTGYDEINLGGLTIVPFPKWHDAADPFSFVVQGNGVNIGVFTDIGSVCEDVIKNFKTCNAIFLETNYDENMLAQGNYPYPLKQRIRGDYGHLSNHQALQLFVEHRPDYMSHVFLSHLSKDNNSPELVHNLFKEHAGGVEVVVASRYNETEVYHIRKDVKTGVMEKPQRPATRQSEQMKLF
jgi:phosphoribosyl 1,2-cyclic phosphodiesterase